MSMDPPAQTQILRPRRWYGGCNAARGDGSRFPRMDRLYERVRGVYLTADLRSLAAGRIVLALVLLRDLFGRWAELGIWYTNDGIIPNHTLLWRPPWDHVFSLFYLASYTHEAVIGFVICLFAYLALLVGFRTKLAQIAATDLHAEPARPHAAVRQRRRRGARPADDLDDVPPHRAAASPSTRCWPGGARRRQDASRRRAAPAGRERAREDASSRWACWR